MGDLRIGAERVVLACLALGALALLAFGPRGGTVAPPGRTVVVYWEKWTGNEGAQMQQIVDDFNNSVGAAQGIYVQYLSVSSVDRKTLVATAAGVPPDIAGLWDGQVAQFASQDAVEPLDDLAREYGITEEYYKPVYWRGCTYHGHLWGLVSTPWAVALHYNRRVFNEEADQLRAAGLDPTRPPRTLEEVDRYAVVFDQRKDGRLVRAGFLPGEPGWFQAHTPFWFGASIYDAEHERLTLTDPGVVRAFEWIQSYSRRLGSDAVNDFNSLKGQFNSPQNPFLTGGIAMEQQGPWMANYINDLAPAMYDWKAPDQYRQAPPNEKGEARMARWLGTRSLEERRAWCEWAAAPFPSAVGQEGATFAGFDVLMIPKGAKHKREAFAFIAYVNRQDVQEKLSSLHSKNSALRQVSPEYLRNHPNPYIDVFEQMAGSPNAQPIPPIPIWPEVNEELTAVIQRITLLQQEPREALAVAQERLQRKLDLYLARQAARRQGGGQ